MLENLAYLHYGYMYEQGEKVSEISLEPPKNGLALLLALCTWITSSESATAAPVLEYGNSGEAVVSLQNQLKQANCLPQDASSDGRYGEITRAAITRLQQQHKLLVDGIAGKQTYAALDANQTCTASTSNTGPKLGDRGKEVELLQIQLANWGFPLDQKKRLEPTGKFDLATQEALQEFEKSFELEPDDGRLDPQTSKILWQPRIEALIEASRYEYWSDYTLRWITSALKKDATKAVPKLLTLLRDRQNDSFVRTIAAETLGYMGVEANQVIPSLITVATNKTEEKNLRRQAVKVIGGFGADARDAVEPLLVILRDKAEEERLRKQVVDSLSEIGPAAQAAIPTLITLLDDKN